MDGTGIDDGSRRSVPDLTGDGYLSILERIHSALSPKSYFEIGTHTGASLVLGRCATIAVDPHFKLKSEDFLGNKPYCGLYQISSDDFFESVDPTAIFRRKIDFAFLDGMHRCEFLLRDFANTERYCRRNSIVALHDCLPVETLMAERTWGDSRIQEHRTGWWAGDVWRTALVLKRRRPDLHMTTIAAPPTGLILITNLDPQSNFIMSGYKDLLKEMMAMDLETIGVKQLHDELGSEPQSVLDTHDKITARFWL